MLVSWKKLLLRIQGGGGARAPLAPACGRPCF